MATTFEFNNMYCVACDDCMVRRRGQLMICDKCGSKLVTPPPLPPHGLPPEVFDLSDTRTEAELWVAYAKKNKKK